MIVLADIRTQPSLNGNVQVIQKGAKGPVVPRSGVSNKTIQAEYDILHRAI